MAFNRHSMHWQTRWLLHKYKSWLDYSRSWLAFRRLLRYGDVAFFLQRPTVYTEHTVIIQVRDL